jgi:sporulation protein YlmC with PRC-barrel domain
MEFSMTRLLLLAATTALLTSPLQAQTAPTPAPTTPATSTAPSGEFGGIFYGKQYDWRASKLIGTKVSNNANENIGEINDVLLDKNGKVTAAVIGVGGFLGLGERNVAVSFTALNMSRDANGDTQIKVDTTKDVLKGAPEFKWLTTNY